jgi:2-haloacid dehalogenase
MDIKNIVFDFGGVLVDWNPRYLYNKLFEDEEQMEFFLQSICTPDWNEQQDAGRSLTEATDLLVNKHPEHESMIRQYYDRWEEMLKDDISANVSVLNQLKGKYRLFGLSNWSGETFPAAFRRFPFFKEFEGIVISGDEKMKKPDPEIYHLLLSRYQIEAENSTFIDDNAENIRAAKEIGFSTVHFNQETDLEVELKKMNLL